MCLGGTLRAFYYGGDKRVTEFITVYGFLPRTTRRWCRVGSKRGKSIVFSLWQERSINNPLPPSLTIGCLWNTGPLSPLIALDKC